MMNFDLQEELVAIQDSVQRICDDFGPDYWLERDRDGAWPEAFCDAIARGGWFGITMPTEVGGAGLGISAAAMVMRTLGKLGSSAVSSVHLNLFGPQPVAVFGTDEQKQRMLRPLVNGQDRACFGVTEPSVGSDTTRIKTVARRVGDRYVVDGQKVWTSTAQQANKILLVARTTPIDQCKRPIDGITIFYTDLDRSKVRIREIEKMARKAVDSNELFIDGLEIPVSDRIGAEGSGFKYLLHGLNPERVLVAASALGGAEVAIERASAYAKDRVVFGRPIGQNQAIQHPLAECWTRLRSAELMMWKAAWLYDADRPCGVEATAAKFLAAEVHHEAALRAVRTHGGFGFAKEYHVERGLRESVLTLLAPVSQELALCFIAERALGLPKSY
jgi:acyl-CoA dehydrogenase